MTMTDDKDDQTAAYMLGRYEARGDQPAAEAVQWGVDWGKNGDRTCVSIIKRHADGTAEVVTSEYEPGCIAPPAPAQVPLTDDEIDSIYDEVKGKGWSQDFARAVIAAFCRKNGITATGQKGGKA